MDNVPTNSLYVALKYNASYEDVKRILHDNPEAAKTQNKYGNLPLLTALQYKASSDVIKTLLKAYPKAIEVPDKHGYLPLHLALSYKASIDVIKTLLQAYPQAVEATQKDGWLPLHLALCNNATPDVISMLFNAHPKAAEVQNNGGALPLHCALWLKAPSDIIKIIFQAYPKAAAVQDNEQCLPLHLALCKNATSDVINMLFEENPQAAEVQNKYERRFPLHFACMSKANLRESFLEVLNLLISSYPEGIDAKDAEDKLPSDYLKREVVGLHSTEHLYLLYKAVKAGFCTGLVKLLVRAFPESCITKDNDGMVPLHHACKGSAANHLEVVITLFDANEDSLDIKDNQGRSPMQILKIMVSHQVGSNLFPLHHLAASSDCLREKSLLLLFNAYPESIRTPDNNGILPFHHACLNHAVSLDVLMLFVSLYPEAVNEVQVIDDDKNVANRPFKRKK
jgi:ankyrin repeat protein